MGKSLMMYCPSFARSIERCDEALKTIPKPPSWSIKHVLALGDVDISKAELSQPLCTAVQIALTDLLFACGIKFNTVIGHSSGEIGAAYASGILSIRDAMAIAYYRGHVAHLAKGSSGQRGSMMAIGMSLKDAVALASRPDFAGRLWVAASNAPSSTTLSGDRDAIMEAKDQLDMEGIFARPLKVDTAYHSSHMSFCKDSYLALLKQLEIQVSPPRADCAWYSSVYQGTDLTKDSLDPFKGQYWVDNMVKPVLFSQALETAFQNGGPFAMGLEVGPHSALKGPVGQTLKQSVDLSLPYTGCLERASDDIESFAKCLGTLWTYLGSSTVNLEAWCNCFGTNNVTMIKGLPPYSWDHDRVYWFESRLSHNYRLGVHHTHELLGRIRDECGDEMSWRNILRLNEMPWLRGHMFQGQVIFPAAGYVSMAVQAAVQFVRNKPIRSLELRDVRIIKALVIEESGPDVETIFTVRAGCDDHLSEDSSSAEFVCYSCSDGQIMEKSCHGRLLITFGLPNPDTLPTISSSESTHPPLEVERFFTAMAGLGIEYDGVFRALQSINRVLGHAEAGATWEEHTLGDQYLLHPAVLDIGFQVGFATFASIAEKAIGSTYLPAAIKRITINPIMKDLRSSGQTNIGIEAQLARSTSTDLEVDIDLFDKPSNITGVQVEGLVLKAVAEPLASDDRILFAKTVWAPSVSCGIPNLEPTEAAPDELVYIDAVERTALYFMQNLVREIQAKEISTFKWHHQAHFRAIEEFIRPIREGRHPVLKKDCLNDTRADIAEFATRYPDSVDLGLLTAVGENLASVMRGESEMLEHMLNDNLLGRLYMEGRGFAACNVYAAEFMRKVSHSFPRAKIFEIGAGTGGTTRSVLDAIGDAYLSYTYTDISAGFFEKAAEKFSDHASKMEFKTFNAERTPSEQGFQEGYYDVLIAANVLHATRDLVETMRRARSLLRPGGFLIAVEVTGTMLREPGLMGGLEGWWLGCDDGRFPSPGISAEKWHELLQSTGFSGIESVIYDSPDISRHNCSVFITQATDEELEILRDPLGSASTIPNTTALIIGGRTLSVSKVAKRAEKLLRRRVREVLLCNSFESLDPAIVTSDTSIVCLTELDAPLLSHNVSTKTLENLQESLGNARDVLWVTSGRLNGDPYSNMMVGVGRALSYELPHVSFQFLDLERQAWDMDTAVQSLLRMALLSSPEYRRHDMLWVHEPEVVISAESSLVPRVVPDNDANEGLNSRRRRCTKFVHSSERIEVLHELPCSRVTKTASPVVSEGTIELNVKLSITLESHTKMRLFLCFGHLISNGRAAFAFSKTDTSVVTAPKRVIFEPLEDIDCDAELLNAVRLALIALRALEYSDESGTMLIYDPTPSIAEAVTRVARETGKKVLVAGSSPPASSRTDFVTIHALAQPRTVRKLLPEDVNCILRFSEKPVHNITACFPVRCSAQNFGFRLDPQVDVQAIIAAAYQSTKTLNIRSNTASVQVARLGDVGVPVSQHVGDPPVLDWRRTEPLQVTIPPLDFSGLFRPDRTYLMVGLTGELGQSLCRFMIQCGARHIVLASRNPSKDSSWLEDISVEESSKLQVRIVSMDVTDASQVKHVVSDLRETMPAIAGVANGALVLDDTLFVNAAVSGLQKQLSPKVGGTINLDNEFAKEDLDFFIAFSSLGSVYGNPGQSIYHAANMFMTGLVERRRVQGKSGSVIHIGMIVDVGYVAERQRAGTKIEEHLRSQFYTPLAEVEFHHLFAQAVISSHPRSENGDLIMGILPFVDDPNASTRPQWYNNPRFSHMIIPPGSLEGVSQSSNSMQQVRERLSQASSIPEATDAFAELFCHKIEAMMKISAASIDVNAPLSELGLDSLLAVEIRTWLLRDMNFDVPILKILGREPMRTICSDFAQKLLVDRDPNSGSQPSRVTLASAEYDHIPRSARSTDGSQSTSEDTSSGKAEPSSPVSTSVTTDSDFFLQPETEVLDIQDENSGHKRSHVAKHVTQAGAQHLETTVTYERTERMSYSQSSLYFLQSLLEDRTTFNVTAQYSITGQLNVSRFQRALEKTIARHESYRTCFFSEPGSLELKQGIASNVKPKRFIHLPLGTDQDIEETFSTLSQFEWDLATGDTFRFVLFTHNAESHTLVIGCHHIIMDGMSWHIFLQDLDRSYRLLPLEEPELSLIDFAQQEIEAIATGRRDDSMNYWKSHLNPLPPAFPLLSSAETNLRKPQHRYSVNILERKLGPETVQTIKKASQACGSTSMQFYLAVLQALLAQVLDVEDICIGVADAGRGDEALNRTIGHFTNILPMRFHVSQEQSFADVVSETAKVVLNGYSHAHIPLDVIMKGLEIQRSSSSTPLFQVAFNYRVGDMLHGALGNCSLHLDRYLDAKTPFDFTFNVTKAADGGDVVEIFSNSDLYSTEVTASIMSAFLKLLGELCLEPSVQIKHCKTYSEADVQDALRLGQGGNVDYDLPDSLPQRFDQVVAERPSARAIKDEFQSMSYADLANRSNSIATLLLNASASVGTRVGVMCEPSIDTYAAMIAILRIGAVYVPLDLSLPVVRRQVMIQACKMSIVLYHASTSKEAEECIGESKIALLNLDEKPEDTLELSSVVIPDESFLLFTSGSTGTPKGISLPQSGIMNYAASKRALLQLGPITVLQQSSTGFDMSIAQAFNAFCNGGTLIVVPRKARGDPTIISRLMLEEKIELTLCTPSELLMLAKFANDTLRGCTSWQHACSGGEAVTLNLLSELRRLELPNLSLTDCYGPTEISCATTFRQISLRPDAEPINLPQSVGKPIPNTSIYILGEDQQPLPVGYAGEIAIGGRGVANGYLGHNSGGDRFVHNPFATSEYWSRGWNTMYKTGDRGYLRGDGSLTFVGRTDGDTLVKLRGLRIELGEVASAILQSSQGAITDAVVSMRGEPEFLVAHIVVAQGSSMSEKECEELCTGLPLPRYMIPSVVIPLQRLPITPNGKVDRKAIAQLELPSHGPQTTNQEKLTVAEGELRLVWRDVLGDSGSGAVIGAESDFFMVGGSSLLLVHLQGALKEKMGIHMQLHELYQASTLRRMAAATSQERSQLAPEAIDWTAETAIPGRFLVNPQGVAASKPRQHDRRVLLTGSTDFLGSLVLERLLQDEHVSQVLCIAVPSAALHTVPTHPKIKNYLGSLQSTSLGLTGGEIDFLQTNVDQIIHAGAQGHCLNSYNSVKTANYLSTQFLAMLALPRKIPFHFVSSGRVILQSGSCEAGPVSMATHSPPVDGSQGFTSSKWASEVFLENIAQETCLPVVIHRPCSIVGDRAPHNDAMNSVIKYSLLSRTVPDVPNARGFFGM